MDSGREELPIRAAQYLRMSTEHQRYSLEHQSVWIAAYAAEHGYEVVKTYSDAGKSGLRIRGREALSNLLKDVVGGQTSFKVILVLDVSRWGRFQDPDQAAHYEYITSHLGLQLYEDPEGRPILRGGRCQWFLREPLVYEVGAERSDETITVPACNPTGLSSMELAARLMIGVGRWSQCHPSWLGRWVDPPRPLVRAPIHLRPQPGGFPTSDMGQ